MTAVAWDIETCPVPLDALSRAQQARYDNELAYKLSRESVMDRQTASRLVRSIHPFLGWICCISAVSGTLDSSASGSGASGRGHNEPVSWTASSPGEEAGLLEAFWSAVADFPPGTTWVTFNGKRFDVPYVEARSVAHGLTPSRADLRDTYPYNTRPHADLACLWPQHYSLDGLCDLLGVPSPKGGRTKAGSADVGSADAGAAKGNTPGMETPGMETPVSPHAVSHAHAGDASGGAAPPVDRSGDGMGTGAIAGTDAIGGTGRIGRMDGGRMDESRIDGSDVAQLVESGQLRALAAYAERDAVATWRCAQRLLPQL